MADEINTEPARVTVIRDGALVRTNVETAQALAALLELDHERIERIVVVLR